jgi:hypothetical protein
VDRANLQAQRITKWHFDSFSVSTEYARRTAVVWSTMGSASDVQCDRGSTPAEWRGEQPGAAGSEL